MKGEGKIKIMSENELLGISTKFVKSVRVGDTIRFISEAQDNIKVEDQIVKEVVSDTELSLKDPGCHIYQPDFEYKFKIIPKLDQGDVFRNVEKHLSDNGSIGIFPEGGSHDQSHLLPFKAGIAIMALGTIQKYPGTKVQVVPCGLKYFKPHQFRSKVIIEFGRPYTPSQKIIDMYNSGDKRKAVTLFMKDIVERMEEVTLTAPTYNEL